MRFRKFTPRMVKGANSPLSFDPFAVFVSIIRKSHANQERRKEEPRMNAKTERTANGHELTRLGYYGALPRLRGRGVATPHLCVPRPRTRMKMSAHHRRSSSRQPWPVVAGTYGPRCRPLGLASEATLHGCRSFTPLSPFTFHLSPFTLFPFLRLCVRFTLTRSAWRSRLPSKRIHTRRAYSNSRGRPSLLPIGSE